MSIFIGNKVILSPAKIFVGGTPITEVYKASVKIWPLTLGGFPPKSDSYIEFKPRPLGLYDAIELRFYSKSSPKLVTWFIGSEVHSAYLVNNQVLLVTIYGRDFGNIIRVYGDWERALIRPNKVGGPGTETLDLEYLHVSGIAGVGDAVFNRFTIEEYPGGARFPNKISSFTIDNGHTQELTELSIRSLETSTLDTSKVLGLERLIIYWNRRIGSLNISNNVNLKVLYIYPAKESGFKFHIDISNNPKLRSLIVYDGDLVSDEVNEMLVHLDHFGLHDGSCRIDGHTPPAPPTGAGITAKANLIAKGWGVTTD